MTLPEIQTISLSEDSSNKNTSKMTKKQTIVGEYKLCKTLEKGKFGVVKLGKHIVTGDKVAIKVIDKLQQKQRTLDEMLKEADIMKRLDHHNIIKVHEIIDTENTFYIIMEYASNGDLFSCLDCGRMDETEAKEKFQQIISAVRYCHEEKNVIHRDLKPDNILFDSENNIKIADFGLSEEFVPGEKFFTFCGTPEYMAPEVFQGHKFDGPKVDVWSLGVMLYEMLTATLPFPGSTWPHIIERVLHGKYYVPEYISQDCRELLSKMLVLDPSKRATMDVVMKDAWVNSMSENQKNEPKRRSRTPSHCGG
jgi:MAP/microtubule affinity-regulating kinase